MIFMALLPKSDDMPVSHGSQLPTPAEFWATVTVALAPRVGDPARMLGGGRYKIATFDDQGFTLVRTASGKPVRITRKKAEDAYRQLWAGKTLTFREISYTVAIEFGVLLALGTLVEADETTKTYRLKRS